MTQQAKVFVTHRTRLDMGEAEKFGAVVYVCGEEGQYPAMDGAHDRKVAIFQDFDLAMQGFDDSKDYLLMVGDPIYCGLLMWFAMNRTDPGDTLKVLRYDRQLGVYIPVQVKV